MNSFDERVATIDEQLLHASGLDLVQVNVGLLCNQSCMHCHLECSPVRPETMTWPIMETVVETVGIVRPRLVDVTGGAPELNPDVRRFIAALREADHAVQLRTNLTVLVQPGMESMPAFLRDHQVQLVASLPCYLEENVSAQRGADAYKSSIEALRRLNALGYGTEPAFALNLVYNPAGPFLPPDQSALEADYRRELGQRFGVTFTRLLTIANMPIGRFLRRINREQGTETYMNLLREAFNPATVADLMCRHQISIGWDGTLYDCDFNLALGWAVDHGSPSHIRDFDPDVLARRRIVTGEHCFGCTAGAGSSCAGALV